MANENIKRLSETIVENITENFTGNINGNQLRKTISSVLKDGEKFGTIKKVSGRYCLEPDAASSLRLTGLFLQELASKCGPCSMKPKRKARSRSRSTSRSSGCKPARKVRKTRKSRPKSAGCKPRRAKKVSRKSKAIKKSKGCKPMKPRKPKRCMDIDDTDEIES